jgi:hypothetical protein
MTGCGTSRRRSYIALPLQVRRQQEQGGGKGLCLLAPLNGTRLSMKSKAFPLLFPFVTSFVPLLLLFACSLPFSSLFIPSLPVKNKMEKSTNGVRPTTNSKAFPLLSCSCVPSSFFLWRTFLTEKKIKSRRKIDQCGTKSCFPLLPCLSPFPLFVSCRKEKPEK